MSSKSSFFEQGSFALVGDTRQKGFPALTERYLKESGRRFTAVDLSGAGGGRAASLDEVPAGTEAAIVEVSKEGSAQVVSDLLQRGYRKIWLHQGTDSEEALRLAKEQGADLFTGGCAVMYISPSTSMHVMHRAIWKLLGKY